jgi:glycyl-tRNA synthetase beta chain
MIADLLVELFTEELPPKALQRLGDAFAEGIFAGLAGSGLLDKNSKRTVFATPRRLAVLLPNVAEKSENIIKIKKLMPSSVACAADGQPTAALTKRLEKEQATLGQTERKTEGGTEYVFLNQTIAGATLASGLQSALETAIAQLPIPKVMNYQLADGTTTVQFVRPAHGLVALHGDKVVEVSVLGLTAGRTTHGHRFQGVRDIPIATADAYEAALAAHGHVIASFDKRRADITQQLSGAAARLNATLGPDAGYVPLLDEVTALVEQPSIYVGEFDAEFLAVPPECLILTMRQNQKYFPLFDSDGKLINQFLIVSNMRLADPANVIEGNQRVIRPRLADARFFFDTDKKTRLADRVEPLARIVYHNKLGSQLDRVTRMRALAAAIARMLGADPQLADRAALLAKADLVTNMVGEFPELQGIMGRYYALADGEDARVADAVEAHYRPRYAGDRLPDGPIACAVALADKLCALAAMFSIGQQPTGDKDPFGLRRAALGVVRILVENQLSLSLAELIAAAFEPYTGKMQTELRVFFIERMRSYFMEHGYSANEVEAVLSKNPAEISPIPSQLEAVRAFAALPEAASLAAANKRIANILRQAVTKGEILPGNADLSALKDPAEIALFQALQTANRSANLLFDTRDFTGYLRTFATLKVPVDVFFEKIMVMVDDQRLRENRLALLSEMQNAMNRFADIAKLAT